MAKEFFDADDYAALVQEYLNTEDARRQWREYRSGRGWPWERFVAFVSMTVAGLSGYEQVMAVTDKVLGRAGV